MWVGSEKEIVTTLLFCWSSKVDEAKLLELAVLAQRWKPMRSWVGRV